MNKTVIFSYPRSGRHLTLRLLAAGFGDRVSILPRTHEEADGADLIYDHDFKLNAYYTGRRIIALYRDPFECFASYMNMTKEERPHEFTPEIFRKLVLEDWGPFWKGFARKYLLYRAPMEPSVTLIPYFQTTVWPDKTLSQIARVIGTPIDLDAALASEVVNTKRNHIAFPFYDVKTIQEIKELLYPELEMVNQLSAFKQ